MSATIAALTGREVIAFMSATHQDPDLMAQLFVLEPRAGDDGRVAEAEKAPRAGGASRADRR